MQAIDIYPEPEHPSTDQLEGSQLWPSEEDAPGFKSEMMAYTEKMKVVGKAFMKVMGDVLGEQGVFASLQEDNYWYVGHAPGHQVLPSRTRTDRLCSRTRIVRSEADHLPQGSASNRIPTPARGLRYEQGSFVRCSYRLWLSHVPFGG
jgi:hypothetical protein